ncbi:MAG TPA: HEAT repeat domain-containing protein, partial [Chroococcales cyanobacterium]
GNIGQSAELAVPVLIKTVQTDSEPVIRQAAARALGDFGAQATSAVPVLIQVIKEGDKDSRVAAAYGLSSIPAGSSDITSLIALLGDETDSARIAAAKSIGGLGSEAVSAVPALTRLLQDKNDEIKSAAVKALGKIGPDAKAAIPDLKNAMKDPDPEVKSEAADAIRKIKDKR